MVAMKAGSRVVIHIGLAKTGTTYLQRRFVENRDWLRARDICYPEVGQEFSFGHHNIAAYFKERKTAGMWTMEGDLWKSESPREVMDAVFDPGCSCTLLSSEGFSGMTPSEADRLRDAVGDRQVEIVIYLRRRSELCASHWQEEIKHGSSLTFSEFLAAQVLGIGDQVLRIENALAVSLQVFGLESLRIVVFDHLVADGVDLFEYFVSEALGRSCDGLRPPGVARPNASLAPATVECLRALNYVYAREQHDFDPSFLQKSMNFLSTHATGKALLAEVEALLESEGEDLDLATLDREWRARDFQIMARCGSRVLNAKSGDELFRESSHRIVRELKPQHLYRSVPYSRFEEAYRSI